MGRMHNIARHFTEAGQAELAAERSRDEALNCTGAWIVRPPGSGEGQYNMLNLLTRNEVALVPEIVEHLHELDSPFVEVDSRPNLEI